jgi:hypothetical protein
MAKALLIAELSGGDASDLGQEALWTDLEGITWRILVADLADAEIAAANTGAQLVVTSEWDGSPFGDGNIGTVESPEVGVLVADHNEFVGLLPAGWTVRASDD